MSPNSKDCLECRLTSGGGLIGGGLYVISHGRKFKSFNRVALVVIGSALALTGTLRIFNLPPFRHTSDGPGNSLKIDKTDDDNGYIIAKLPPRYQ